MVAAISYYLTFVPFYAAFILALTLTPIYIRKATKSGLTAPDMNKRDKPRIPEMGGYVIVFAYMAGCLGVVFIDLYITRLYVDATVLIAGALTVVSMAFIGSFDDLFKMRQFWKAALPLFAALPLVALKVGESLLITPFGNVDLGVVYPLVLVPMGVAGAANLTNTYAGFNGLESGSGALVCLFLAWVASLSNAVESVVVLLAMAGALLAFFFFNKFPARVFPGDVGCLAIGAAIAMAAILGDFEFVAVLCMVPYILDFAIKAVNGFPSTGWWGETK